MAEVKIFTDDKYALIKSDKFNADYTVVKDLSGHIFFEIKISKGTLPEELRGKFSSIEKAVEAFEFYERNVKPSRTKRRDDWQAEKEAKRAELHTETD